MNLEQIEGQMAEFDGMMVSVTVPIRGSIYQAFFGHLHIGHNWEEHIILYEIRHYPDASISFQAQDVQSITPTNTPELVARIVLKSDAPMEKSKFDHV